MAKTIDLTKIIEYKLPEGINVKATITEVKVPSEAKNPSAPGPKAGTDNSEPKTINNAASEPPKNTNKPSNKKSTVRAKTNKEVLVAFEYNGNLNLSITNQGNWEQIKEEFDQIDNSLELIALTNFNLDITAGDFKKRVKIYVDEERIKAFKLLAGDHTHLGLNLIEALKEECEIESVREETEQEIEELTREIDAKTQEYQQKGESAEVIDKKYGEIVREAFELHKEKTLQRSMMTAEKP